MGATYTRQSSYTDGDVITAAHTNDEFNQLLAAFQASTGHTHDGTANEGGPITKMLGTSLTLGDGTAATDITVTFDGETNDGVLKWMEDEDYFEFSDDILIASTEKLQFRDTAIYINSSVDGQLDIVADTEVQIAATTVDLNGNLDVSGSITLAGTEITSTATEINLLDGVTATTSELNILDGVTATTSELNILDGVTATATELNSVDGNTSATSTTVADADRVVYNDAGTMKQVAVTDLDTYFSATTKTLTNKTLTSAVLNGTISGTSIKDEDDMTSDSASHLATQQSIKAYVDATVAATNEVVEDTTPQLGGNLDVNGNSIVSVSNGDISITPNGTGNVIIDGLSHPQADGSAGQFLKTDGAGQLAFATVTAATGNELENVVEDTTPQLGGDLGTNGNLISFPDSASASADRLKFGTGNDTSIYHTGTTTFIQTALGATTVIDTPAISIKYGSEFLASFSGNDSVDLYFNNSKKFETTSTGVTVTGDLTVSGDDIIMATNTSGHIMVADGTSYNPVPVSGDVTIDSTGAVTIAATSVENSMLAGSIADSKLNTISTADKVSLSALDIDGGSDIGADLTASDLIVVDDGAGGTNRKAELSRLTTYMTNQGFSTEDPTALAIALG